MSLYSHPEASTAALGARQLRHPACLPARYRLAEPVRGQSAKRSEPVVEAFVNGADGLPPIAVSHCGGRSRSVSMPSWPRNALARLLPRTCLFVKGWRSEPASLTHGE